MLNCHIAGGNCNPFFNSIGLYQLFYVLAFGIFIVMLLACRKMEIL